MNRLRAIRDSISTEFRVYHLILKHERTPRTTRVLLGAAIAYALSPIDLIPDWLPVVGQLDDILIVPLLVWLGLRFVPSEVVEECRRSTRAVNM
jgi:uncharacterized membrane protein YkvA (DUF1232 family)